MGNKKFNITPLPYLAQLAPCYGRIAFDFNLDNNLDLLICGNSYSNHFTQGELAASRGLLMTGDGMGNFRAISADKSGMSINKDSKAMALLYNNTQDRYNIIISNNNDSLVVYKHNQLPEKTSSVGSRKGKSEIYYGGGYLSQSTMKIHN